MNHDGERSVLVASLIVAFFVCAAPLATEVSAITCPSPGSRVRVCVKNPTLGMSPEINVAGVAINGEITCTGPGMLNLYAYTFPAGAIAPGDTECRTLPEGGAGIVSGMYVHRISVSDPPDQLQYQKGPVLFSTSGTWPEIGWTYFPNVIEVTTLIDVGPGSLREALATANSVSSEHSPVLIRFTVAGELEAMWPVNFDLTAGWITIDGTDSNGNPWIVGDRNASLAGNQDPFPVTIDLNNMAAINLLSQSNTLKGLHIKNTLASGQTQAKNLITVDAFPPDNNVIRAVKLDGGNTKNCLGQGGDCALPRDLIHLQDGVFTNIINVEGHSALDKGVKATAIVDEFGNRWGGGCVEDSWFHHNYRGGLQATAPDPGAPCLVAHRNHIELSGRRLSDNAVVDDGANGMSANASGSELETAENVVWLNRSNGIVAIRGNASYDGQGDYSCGNTSSGLGTSQSMDPAGTDLSSDGGAFVYNAGRGIELSGIVGSAALTPDNALTQNEDDPLDVCDLENNSAVSVDARFNQWREGSPLTCGSGSIDSSHVQNAVTSPLALDSMEPFFPSNVFLEAQTIRIRGAGFNAIDGNPAPTSNGCFLGDDPTESCCVKDGNGPTAANVCVEGASGFEPVSGGGMCVQLYVPNPGVWQPLVVTAVTPTRMVTYIPEPYEVLGCKGGDATLSVSKNNGGPTPDEKSKGYCTNNAQAKL